MSRITSDNHKFIEDIDGALHQMFRTAGITMKPDGDLQRIRDIATNLAKTIEHRAEVKAIEVITVLKDATVEAFNALELEIKDLRLKIEELENRE